MAAPPATPADLAALVDHTILRPDGTRDEVLAAADEAAELGCATVCVSPVHLPLGDRGVPVGTFVGFPSGARIGTSATRALLAGLDRR